MKCPKNMERETNLNYEDKCVGKLYLLLSFMTFDKERNKILEGRKDLIVAWNLLMTFAWFSRFSKSMEQKI